MTSLSDSTITVSLDVDWEFQHNAQLIIERDLTVGGAAVDKLWSRFDAFELPISYLQSSDADLINEWWRDTEQLVFNFDGSCYDVRITNEDQPFRSLNRPYQDLWQGTIIIQTI